MFSIIIPTLNEERVLRKTLTRLQILTAVPYELIISDGLSTDKTLSIAKEFTDKIILHHGNGRQTIANARNMGERIASGEYLLFMDADVTIPHPNTFFSNLLNRFKEDPNLAGITVSIRVEKRFETFTDRLLFGFLDLTTRLRNNVLHIGGASGEFQMIRRSAFKEVGGYNDTLIAYEDFDLFERLGRIAKTRMISSLIVFHTGRRVHKVGHLKLFLIWVFNGIWFFFFQKSFSKGWDPIR